MVEKNVILDAIKQAKEKAPERKFTESVDITINLKNIDMSQPKNRIDETILLPHGNGRVAKIAVLGTGDMITQAKDAKDAELQKQSEALRVAQDGAAAMSEALDSKNAELSNLRASLDGAKAERDAAIAELDSAKAERDAALADLESAKAERDAAIAELDGAKAERDAAVAELESAKAERDAALEANAGAESDGDTAAMLEASKQLSVKLSEAFSESQRSAQAVNDLKAQIAALAEPDASLDAQLTEAIALRDEWKAKVEKLIGKLAELYQA